MTSQLTASSSLVSAALAVAVLAAAAFAVICAVRKALLTRRNVAYAPAESVIIARGQGGGIAFHGDKVAIDRQGSASFVMHGMAGRRVHSISALKAVRLRPAWGGFPGHLRLIVEGSNGSRRPAAGDQDAVLFNKAQQPEFKHLAIALRQAVIAERRGATSAPSPGPGGVRIQEAPAPAVDLKIAQISPPAIPALRSKAAKFADRRANWGRPAIASHRPSTPSTPTEATSSPSGPGSMAPPRPRSLTTAIARQAFRERWTGAAPPTPDTDRGSAVH